MTEQKNIKRRSKLVAEIQEGNEEAFKKFFFEYYDALYSYALQIIKSKEKAKDIVQDVFLQIWRRRKKLEINSSLKAYLFRSIRNTAFNMLGRDKSRGEVLEKFKMRRENNRLREWNNEKYDAEKVDKIWDAVMSLPPRRQSVLLLHRKNGLSYKEISEVLEISVKTVENHMGLALRDIRAQVEN